MPFNYPAAAVCLFGCRIVISEQISEILIKRIFFLFRYVKHFSHFNPNRMILLINDQNWNEPVVLLKKKIIHYNEQQADWGVNFHMILALIICIIQHNDACNNKWIHRIHIIHKHLYMEQIIHHPIYIHMKMIQNIIRYVYVRVSSVGSQQKSRDLESWCKN